MKIFKGLVSLYLAAYSFSQLFMLFIGPFEWSVVFWSTLLMIPAVVLFQALRGESMHWVFHAIGIVALLKMVLAANQFVALEGVTMGMYASFLPMLLAMVFLLFKERRSAI